MNNEVLYKNYIIYFISTLMIIIIFYQLLWIHDNKEGFSTKDIDKIFNQTNNIMNIAKNIPNQVNNVSKEIKNAPQQIIKEVETTVTKKLRSVLTQIGDIFMKGIINPILAVFIGIQTIFIQIFKILKKIVDKIIGLPSCMFTYLFKTFMDTIYAIYASIIPKFIRSPISTIYKYTLRYPVDFISYHTGYDASVKRCYGFNVDDEIGQMNNKLSDIDKAFKKDFGKLNFNKIKI
jgi:hypothetical protein